MLKMKGGEWTPEQIAEIERRHAREAEIMAGLPENLPELTKVIMAQDMRAAEDALAAVERGEIEPKRALSFAGSYARIETLKTLVHRGKISLTEALDLLPELWPISDPDDTDPVIIRWWHHAYHRAGRYVTDEGKKLPRRKSLTVWRGQRRGDPLGCAWSLSREIAEKFARGASFRTANPDPELVELTIDRSLILAYLTGRGEEEVIIDPRFLSRVEGAT